jgi:hypothetical protein
VAVVDLEVGEAVDAEPVAGGDGPVEVGVVDGGEGLGAADVLHVAPDGVGDGGAMLGVEFAGQVEGVDVDRPGGVFVGELLGGEEEELLFGAQGGVEGGDVGEVIVVGEGEELVAVLAISGGDFEGRGVAVAVEGVEIAFVPARLAGLPGRADLGEGDSGGEQGQEGQANNPSKRHRGNFIVSGAGAGILGLCA